MGLRRADRYRQYATELVALVPDVLVAATSLVAAALQRETRSVPIDALCRDATKRQFDVVMAWNVDRLGRSLKDLVAFLSELHALGIGASSGQVRLYDAGWLILSCQGIRWGTLSGAPSARRPPSPRAGAGAKSIRYSRSAAPVP